MRRLAWAAALLLAGATVRAAPEPSASAGPGEAGCLAIHAGTVHLPDGPVADHTVVVRAGRIEAIVPGDAPGDCIPVELGDAQLTAGLVDPAATVGLVEVGMEAPTRDTDGGGDPVRAAFRVVDAYNPLSTVVPVARLGGLTSAVVVPSGGLVAGQAGWVDLVGRRQAEAIVAPSVAMRAHWGASGISRAATLLRLREVLDDARTWSRDRAAWARGASRPYDLGRLDLDALVPVVEGRLPLVVTVDRAADIEALVRMAREEDIRLVLDGAAEGWLVADLLAEAGVPVIVDPLVPGPTNFDRIHARPDNAAMLAQAGVQVMISTHSAHFARKLRQAAGNAVREGMDPVAALRAITVVPAEVFGQPDHAGIAPGNVANLVAWSGDPLELTTAVRGTWIRGRPQPLVSRQTLLRDRWMNRTLTGAWPVEGEAPEAAPSAAPAE